MIWWRRTNIHKKNWNERGEEIDLWWLILIRQKHKRSFYAAAFIFSSSIPWDWRNFFRRCFFLFIFFITSFVSVLCKLIFLRMAKKMLMVMWFILWIQLILMPYVYFLNISCSISTQCEFHYGYFVSLLVLLLFSYFTFFDEFFENWNWHEKKLKRFQTDFLMDLRHNCTWMCLWLIKTRESIQKDWTINFYEFNKWCFYQAVLKLIFFYNLLVT